MQRLEHLSIRVNGLTLRVAAAGPENGPLLIFLHGFPDFWGCWRNQITHFAEAGFRVLAPDQRGYNLSDKPETIAAYGIDTLADDILGLIDWAGRRSTLLVGHDWGAAVAWRLALKYPGRIEKLAILNVPHPRVMKENLKGNPIQLMRSWYMLFFQLPSIPEWGLRFGRFWNLRRTLVGSSRPGTFSEENLKEYIAAWSQPGALTGMLNWYRAGLRHAPAQEGDQRVVVPTLMIWGARDRFLGREMARPSVELCDKGRLELIEEATHWVQHEEPERVNALLEGFFREKPS